MVPVSFPLVIFIVTRICHMTHTGLIPDAATQFYFWNTHTQTIEYININNNNNNNNNNNCPHSMSQQPVVFLDISLGAKPIGRVQIQLFHDKVPLAADNFRQFCTGEYRENLRPLGYKGCLFHRVIKDKIIQSGDFIHNNGLGSKTVHGNGARYFNDESPGLQELKHTRGTVSMANSGPNTNGCQFFICLDDLPELDGKHVVVGQVVSGMDTVDIVSHVSVNDNNRPHPIAVSIAECGEM